MRKKVYLVMVSVRKKVLVVRVIGSLRRRGVRCAGCGFIIQRGSKVYVVGESVLHRECYEAMKDHVDFLRVVNWMGE